MKREEAEKIQKKWKAEILRCSKCGEYAIYVDPKYNACAWRLLGIGWDGIHPICICGGRLEKERGKEK